MGNDRKREKNFSYYQGVHLNHHGGVGRPWIEIGSFLYLSLFKMSGGF